MNRLKELRKENDLTQDELSKIIGVNLRTLQKWENGESSIRKKNAEKLAKNFGVSVGYLLGYDTDNVLLDALSKKIADLRPEEFVEYTKTTEYIEERELFESLNEKVDKELNIKHRKVKIGDISGLLKGLDLDDLYLVNSFVERLYFSEHSLEDDEKLDNKREQLRKELEQSET